jgi:bacteriocin-like protein
MAQKNLMAQVAGFLKRTTTGELPAPELAELSEEALQQIVGGVETTIKLPLTETTFRFVLNLEYPGIRNRGIGDV